MVVFTQDTNSSLGVQTLSHFELLFKVWAARTLELGQLENIQYILPFENRGPEIGVTLNHPHGQIYAYPVVPPVPANKQFHAKNYYKENGRSLLEVMIEQELIDGKRIIYLGEHAVAFVPACARYPYEVWLAPIKTVASFADLNDAQRSDLARALKTVLMKFDALWARPFPYLMSWFQAPTDNKPHPESHLHAEFYPPYKTAEKLKFLAGTEIAASLFAMDCLPEDKALELQNVNVDIEHD